ncbi:MAG TPA: hypothetical protein VIV12_21405 [Streptosporangiaceae bacterium]
MPDGSPPSSPLLNTPVGDITALITSVLDRQKELAELFEQLGRIDPSSGETLTTDEVRALPIAHMHEYPNAAARIAARWATGSDATSPADFAASLCQASELLTRLVKGTDTGGP